MVDLDVSDVRSRLVNFFIKKRQWHNLVLETKGTNYEAIFPQQLPTSLLTRLVSVAALLRRYSPWPYPLLSLLNHVPALRSNN